MALTLLADATDLAAWLGRALTAEEAARAAVLLPAASAAVRAHVRQQITRNTTTQRLKPYGEQRTVGSRYWPSFVRLPQRPVNAVTAVVDIDGVPLVDGVSYRWVGGQEIVLIASGPVDVTYDHGLDATNDDMDVLTGVKGVACQAVGRALGRPADETALTQEQVDGYSYTVGAKAASGPFGLMDDEEDALDRMVGRSKATTLRLA